MHLDSIHQFFQKYGAYVVTGGSLGGAVEQDTIWSSFLAKQLSSEKLKAGKY
jgi:hypothetical protein